METGFIVYQHGYAIFGIGNTLEEALADCAREGGPIIDIEQAKTAYLDAGIVGEFYYSHATKNLLNFVEQRGGTAWEIRDGLAMTEKEAEEFDLIESESKASWNKYLGVEE